MWYQLRSKIPLPLKRMMREAAYATFVSDVESFRAYRELSRDERGQAHGLQKVRLRPLENREVELRRGTTDAITVFTTFLHRYHRPPRGARLGASPIILDLGANIGLTMADYAVLYPGARVFGVELDAGNAEVCRRNTAPWADRCTLLEGAVWKEDGEISYEVSFGSEDAFSVTGHEGPKGGRTVTAKAMSLTSIFKAIGDPAYVDYVKMDIEGAEKFVLEENADWLLRVRSIKVELHGDYGKEQAIAALERHGLRARPDTYHAHCVSGVRPA